jgi:WD40 repeat protein
VTFLTFSPDGKTLATLSNGDDTLRLWDVATAAERARLKQATGPTCSLAFSPDGKSLAAGSYEKDGEKVRGMVVLWDTATGKKRDTLPVANGPVTAVAFAQKGALAAGSFSALADGTITTVGRGVTKVVLVVWEPKGARP